MVSIRISITIPDNLKSIIKEIVVTPRKKIEIVLGQKYSFKKIKEPISINFATFETEIKKALTLNNVEEKDIPQVISLVENNHVKIYPDNDDEGYDDDDDKSKLIETEFYSTYCKTQHIN